MTSRVRNMRSELRNIFTALRRKLRLWNCRGLEIAMPDHGPDVSDWLDLGNTRENLGYIAEKAPEWAPPTPKDGWRAHVFTAASLKEKKFEPISYVVPLLIPEGVTILAGKPKVGKSWLALDLGLTLAAGRFILGEIKLIEGDVLYAALEDNDRRLRSRIERILTQNEQKWPPRLTLATQWRRLDAGGVADAKEWAASVTAAAADYPRYARGRSW